MIGLHLKYDDHSGTSTMRVGEYSFDGEAWHKGHEKKAPHGKLYALKCKCGGQDWSNNGRHLNEYECQCCGQFLQVTELITQ